MNRFCALFVCLLLVVPGKLVAAPAHAVDDSGSQVLGGLVRMDWVDPAPGASNLLAGQVTVLVRLDVAAWVGRNVRIYQVLDQHSTPVRAEWTTRGPMLPGAVADGERALVYSGPVSGTVISDTLVLTIFADGSVLDRPEVLDFHFELELEGQ